MYGYYYRAVRLTTYCKRGKNYASPLRLWHNIGRWIITICWEYCLSKSCIRHWHSVWSDVRLCKVNLYSMRYENTLLPWKFDTGRNFVCGWIVCVYNGFLVFVFIFSVKLITYSFTLPTLIPHILFQIHVHSALWCGRLSLLCIYTHTHTAVFNHQISGRKGE